MVLSWKRCDITVNPFDDSLNATHCPPDEMSERAAADQPVKIWAAAAVDIA